MIAIAGIKDVRLRRASRIPLTTEFRLPLGLSLSLSLSFSRERSNSEDRRAASSRPPDPISLRLGGFYSIRSGVSSCWNPDAVESERANERPAAALAAFFARCEIARVLRGVSRARVFLRVYSSLLFLRGLCLLPRVSAGVRVWVAGRGLGRATSPIASARTVIDAPARPRVRDLRKREGVSGRVVGKTEFGETTRETEEKNL